MKTAISAQKKEDLASIGSETLLYGGREDERQCTACLGHPDKHTHKPHMHVHEHTHTHRHTELLALKYIHSKLQSFSNNHSKFQKATCNTFGVVGVLF